MPLAIKSLSDAWAFIFILQLVVMLALDREELRARITLFSAESSRVPIIWGGPGVGRCFLELYWVWLVLRFADLISGHHSLSNHPKPPISQTVLGLVIFFALLGLLSTIDWMYRKKISLEAYLISRGKLMKSFKSLSGRCGDFFTASMPLYVLPADDFAKKAAYMRRGAIVPRQFLDQLSRREIDSILARQISLQSKEFYSPVFWPVLIINCLGALTAWKAPLGSLSTGLLFLSLLIAEMIAVRLAMPRMVLRAGLQSIRLTGFAEDFFSAQGHLDRFGGARLTEETLQEIGRKEEVTSDRITVLLAEHTRVEDKERYPTTGSYLDTGL
jgi:hypothetical protein